MCLSFAFLFLLIIIPSAVIAAGTFVTNFRHLAQIPVVL